VYGGGSAWGRRKKGGPVWGRKIKSSEEIEERCAQAEGTF